MSKEILLLGEFSTGKSAFINMLLGVSILPERLEATDIPVIKISGDSPAGIWLREPNQINLKPLDRFSDIPQKWDSFEYAEITIPSHPLLKRGLILWDTPGINSTNPHHSKHLQNFLENSNRNFAAVYFFIHSNTTSTSINFIKGLQKFRDKLTILIIIKDVKPEQECRIIEKEVKKSIKLHLGNLPVDLLYIGDLCDEFNILSEGKRKGLSDWELIKDWDKRSIDLNELRNKYGNSIIGEEIFDYISELSNVKEQSEEEYLNLTSSELLDLVKKSDHLAEYYLSLKCLYEGKLDLGLKLLTNSGNNGIGIAQYDLAILFKEGIFGPKNLKLYHKYLQLAVTNNISEAIAEQYFEGINTIKNPRVGFSVLENALLKGDNKVYNTIAECYAEGKGTNKDLAQAEKYFRLAQQNGEPIYQLSLAEFLYKQTEEEKIKEGRKILQNLVEKRNFLAIIILISVTESEENWNLAYNLIKDYEGKNFLADSFLARLFIHGLGVEKNEKRGFELLKNVYDKGSTFSISQLAECYQDGIGVKIDKDRAASLFKEGMLNGDLDCKYGLASLLMQSPDNKEEGIELFEELVTEGYEQAIIDLGIYYSQSNTNKAIKLFKMIEDKNLPLVNYYLGNIFLTYTEKKSDQKKGVEYLEKAAHQGVPDSMNLLGMAYLNGWGVEIDEKKAFELVEKSALNNSPDGQSNLGLFYWNGINTPVNIKKSIEWLNKAIENGNDTAMFHLAELYETTEGNYKDTQKAFIFYQKASEMGNIRALNKLGMCYLEGMGTTRNSQKAFKFFKKAADAGNVDAHTNLGVLYFAGEYVEVDYITALKYFEVASEQNDSGAQYFLGKLYENGLGVNQDINRAWYWYEKAADQGHEDAIQAINHLNKIYRLRK